MESISSQYAGHKAHPERNLLWSRIGLGLCGLGLLLVYPLAWILHPFVTSDKGPVLCAYRYFTHKECPFCGMTRAFSSTMHGDLPAAFSYNSLWWIPFVLLACLGLICLSDSLLSTRILSRLGSRVNRPAIMLLALFLAYGVYRAFQ